MRTPDPLRMSQLQLRLLVQNQSSRRKAAHMHLIPLLLCLPLLLSMYSLHQQWVGLDCASYNSRTVGRLTPQEEDVLLLLLPEKRQSFLLFPSHTAWLPGGTMVHNTTCTYQLISNYLILFAGFGSLPKHLSHKKKIVR